jgi:hypothetical protein
MHSETIEKKDIIYIDTLHVTTSRGSSFRVTVQMLFEEATFLPRLTVV